MSTSWGQLSHNEEFAGFSFNFLVYMLAKQVGMSMVQEVRVGGVLLFDQNERIICLSRGGR